jgi:hypothetical protein
MTAAPDGPGAEAGYGASVSGAAGAGLAPGSPVGHEHAWALMQFELANGHPVVRQHCGTCGLVRRYRAWERYWSPPNSASSSPTGR